jgi:hypothetical protein
MRYTKMFATTTAFENRNNRGRRANPTQKPRLWPQTSTLESTSTEAEANFLQQTLSETRLQLFKKRLLPNTFQLEMYRRLKHVHHEDSIGKTRRTRMMSEKLPYHFLPRRLYFLLLNAGLQPKLAQNLFHRPARRLRGILWERLLGKPPPLSNDARFEAGFH